LFFHGRIGGHASCDPSTLHVDAYTGVSGPPWEQVVIVELPTSL
jgi:hypothetical protein